MSDNQQQQQRKLAMDKDNSNSSNDEIITKTTGIIKTTKTREITAEELARLPIGSYSIISSQSSQSSDNDNIRSSLTTSSPGVTTITIEKQGDPLLLEQLNRNIFEANPQHQQASVTLSSSSQQASSLTDKNESATAASAAIRLPKMNEKIVIEKSFDNRPLTKQPQIVHQKTTITNITSGPLLMAKDNQQEGDDVCDNVMIDTTTTTNGGNRGDGSGGITTQKIIKTIRDEQNNIVRTTTTTTSTTTANDPCLMKPEDFINPDLLSPEKAAIRIQAAFRGYEVRKLLHSDDENDNVLEKNKKKSMKPKLMKPTPSQQQQEKMIEGKKLDNNLQMAIDDAAETVDQAIKDAEHEQSGNFIERLFGRSSHNKRSASLKKSNSKSKHETEPIDTIDTDENIDSDGKKTTKHKKKKLSLKTKKHRHNQTLDRPQPSSTQTKKIIIKRSHSLDRKPDDDDNDTIDDSNEKYIDGIDTDDDNDDSGNIFKRIFGRKKKQREKSEQRDVPEFKWEYRTTDDINAENVVDIGKSKGVGLMSIGSPKKISPTGEGTTGTTTNILRIETKSYSRKDRDGNVSGNFIIEQKTDDGGDDLKKKFDDNNMPKMIESGEQKLPPHGMDDMRFNREKRGKSKDRIDVSVGKIKLGDEIIDLKITDDTTNKLDKLITSRLSPEPEIRLNEQASGTIDGSFGLKDRFRRGKSKSKEKEIKMPNIDMKGGEIEVDAGGGKLLIDQPNIESDLNLSLKKKKKKREKSKEKDDKHWEFHLPKFGSKGSKSTDLDVDVPDMEIKGPKISTEIDVGNVRIPTDEIDLNIESPKKQNENGKDWEFKMPKLGFKGPKIDVKGPKISGPDVDVNVESPDVKVKGPKVEGDLDVSIDGKKPEGKDWEFKMPKFGFKGPKVSSPDVDVNVEMPDVKVKGRKIEDVKVKSPKIEGDLDISIDGKKPEGKDWEFKMPKFGFKGPKVSGPDVDVNVEMPDVKVKGPKVDMNLESPDIKVKGPKVEGDLDLSIDGKKPEGKDWEFKMPKFGFKGPKISGKDVDLKGPEVDVNVEMPDVKVKGPKVEGDLDLSIDGKKPDVDGKGWEIKMPKFGFKGPKIHGPDVDVNIESPDIKVKGPKVDVDLETPDMKVKGPKVDGDLDVSIDGKKPEADGKGWEIKMPKFGFKGPKIHGPDVDLKGPEVDVNIEKPQVDVKMPELEGDLDVSMKGKKPEGKDWDFKMPKFGFKGPKISGPDVDLKGPKVSGPDVDVNVELPELEGDVDISMKGKKPEGKDWEFKMPKFGFKGPKISGKDVDLKGPDVDVNVEMPDVKVKGPKIEGDFDVSIDGEKPKGKDWEIKMPKFGFKGPKISGKDVDLKGPDVDVNVEMPDVKIKGPKIEDVKVKSPKIEGDLDVSIDGKKPEGKDWEFKMPKFGFKGPKIHGPDVDVNVETPDVKVKGPKVDVNLESPDIKVKGPKVDGELSIDGKKPEGKDWEFKMPKFGFKGPKISGKDVDLKGPEVDVNVEMPDVKMKGPKVEGDLDLSIDGKKPDVDGKGWEIKMPKFGFKGPKIHGPDVDLKGPEVDVNIEKPQVDVKIPELEGDVDISMKGKKPEGKDWEFKMPKFGLKGPKISSPEMELKGPKITGPDLDARIESPDIKVKGPKMESDLDANFGLKDRFRRGKSKDKTSIDIDIETGLETNEIIDLNMENKNNKGFEISLPSFGLGSPKLEKPKKDIPDIDVDADVQMKGKKLKDSHDGRSFEFHFPKFGFKGKSGTLPARGKISPESPDIKVKKSGSDVDIAIQGDIDSPKMDKSSRTRRHFTLPRFKFGMKSPNAKIGSLDKPDIDVKFT
ncbi:LOW QUALITY PROTEIN: uncharacterized protein LOC142645945 [Dermatophagoides pteronyssinus]|uniref:LOW QUALITY PROTEIN: uncharacterized protein LOC142645945 n=1 Tax=Dermatophagoides pteronyssinus TaxID=6956 RepID=UPI003F667A69